MLRFFVFIKVRNKDTQNQKLIDKRLKIKSERIIEGLDIGFQG
jgi:hypothetical protein